MEQEVKVLNDEDVERIVGGNEGLTVNVSMGEFGAMGESEQSGMVGLLLNNGGNPIYSPLKQSSQSSNADSEKLIAPPSAAHSGRDRKGQKNFFSRKEF